jgi:hypothetical protein
MLYTVSWALAILLLIALVVWGDARALAYDCAQALAAGFALAAGVYFLYVLLR